MRILSLRMINFKSLQDSLVVFKNNHISGIYGPNGTGKTSVIEAIKLLKFYFSIPREIKNKEKEIVERARKEIVDYIFQGENHLGLILEIEIKKEIYQLELELTKNNFDMLMTSKEKISVKTNSSRSIYKRLIDFENDISFSQPKIYLYEKNQNFTDCFTEIKEQIFEKNKISIQGIVLELSNFNSFISIFSEEFKKSGNKNKKYEDILKKWEILFDAFNKITIITLKEQALSNLEIIIPFSIYTETTRGTLALDCNNTKKNIYDKREYKLIKDTIDTMNKLFPLLVQGAKLELVHELISKNEDGEKYSVSVYVLREGKNINIYKESTGIMKLFMLLASLINILKEEEAILLVDELDVHIFEYLLSYILKVISSYLKGQLIFTAHNLLPLETLDRTSIILTSKLNNKISYEYFKGRISSSTNLRLKYLKAQYLWTEDNIEPLGIKESKVESTIRELQNDVRK